MQARDPTPESPPPTQAVCTPYHSLPTPGRHFQQDREETPTTGSFPRIRNRIRKKYREMPVQRRARDVWGKRGVKEGQVGRRDSWVQPVRSDRFFSPIKGVCSGSSLHPQSGNYRDAAAGFRETDEPVLLINQPSLDLSGKVPHTSGDLEVAVQFLVHLPAGGLTLASWQMYSKPHPRMRSRPPPLPSSIMLGNAHLS